MLKVRRERRRVVGSILNLRGVYKFELSFVLFEWNLTLIERGVLMNGEKDRRYVQLNKIYITAGQKKIPSQSGTHGP